MTIDHKEYLKKRIKEVKEELETGYTFSKKADLRLDLRKYENDLEELEKEEK